MVSKCANPDCGKPLHYLRDGKIFLLQMRASDEKSTKRVEHFWLCGDCTANFDVRQVGAGVEVVRLARSRRPQPLMVVDAA